MRRPLDFDYTLSFVPLVKERIKLFSMAREMVDFYYFPDGVEPDAAELAGKAFANDHTRAAAVLSEALVFTEQAPRVDQRRAARGLSKPSQNGSTSSSATSRA